MHFLVGYIVTVAMICDDRGIVHAVEVCGGVKVIHVCTTRVEIRMRVVRIGM